MNSRYSDVLEALDRLCKAEDSIKCVTAIGSSTRETVKADEYSDLDLIIVTDDPDSWISGNFPGRLGDISISFTEPTIGGGTERRVIYGGDRDADFIIHTPEQFTEFVTSGLATVLMNRGFRVLYDAGDYTSLLNKHVVPGVRQPQLTEGEFVNLVSDFFFHNIWAYKKLKRGELWSAKLCVDSYLKTRLLTVAELYFSRKNGADVWHDGRFIDRWADKAFLDDLSRCFARYDKEDVFSALQNTHSLFSQTARACAELLSFAYPEKAEETACHYLNDLRL